MRKLNSSLLVLSVIIITAVTFTVVMIPSDSDSMSWSSFTRIFGWGGSSRSSTPRPPKVPDDAWAEYQNISAIERDVDWSFMQKYGKHTSILIHRHRSRPNDGLQTAQGFSNPGGLGGGPLMVDVTYGGGCDYCSPMTLKIFVGGVGCANYARQIMTSSKTRITWLVNGTCHQGANRGLYRTSRQDPYSEVRSRGKLVKGVFGYNKTSSIYGHYGTDFFAFEPSVRNSWRSKCTTTIPAYYDIKGDSYYDPFPLF